MRVASRTSIEKAIRRGNIRGELWLAFHRRDLPYLPLLKYTPVRRIFRTNVGCAHAIIDNKCFNGRSFGRFSLNVTHVDMYNLIVSAFARPFIWAQGRRKMYASVFVRSCETNSIVSVINRLEESTCTRAFTMRKLKHALGVSKLHANNPYNYISTSLNKHQLYNMIYFQFPFERVRPSN